MYLGEYTCWNDVLEDFSMNFPNVILPSNEPINLSIGPVVAREGIVPIPIHYTIYEENGIWFEVCNSMRGGTTLPRLIESWSRPVNRQVYGQELVNNILEFLNNPKMSLPYSYNPKSMIEI